MVPERRTSPSSFVRTGRIENGIVLPCARATITSHRDPNNLDKETDKPVEITGVCLYNSLTALSVIGACYAFLHARPLEYDCVRWIVRFRLFVRRSGRTSVNVDLGVGPCPIRAACCTRIQDTWTANETTQHHRKWPESPTAATSRISVLPADGFREWTDSSRPVYDPSCLDDIDFRRNRGFSNERASQPHRTYVRPRIIGVSTPFRIVVSQTVVPFSGAVVTRSRNSLRTDPQSRR